MVSLVKNELCKIFKKKAIKVLCLVVLFICAISFGSFKLMDSLDSMLESDDYINMLEESLDTYDLTDPAELGWYISDKITVENHKYLKEYDTDSWQRAVLEEVIAEDITCIVNAEVSKQTDLYNECKARLDTYKEEVNSHDWKYFANKELTELKDEKNAFESLLLEASDEEKHELELSLKLVNLKIEGAQYRLDNDIPYGPSKSSEIINSYVNLGSQYYTFNMNKKVKTDDEIANEKRMKSEFYVVKYQLENDIDVSDTISASEMLKFDASTVIFYIIIIVVIIASSSICDEFNNGTIKQLLLRPYKRGKILASKWIATFIVFLLFALYYYVVTALTYGLALGFDTYSNPLVIYDFSIDAVREINVFVYLLINFVTLIPYYVVFLNIALLVAVITGNGAASLGGTLMFYFATAILNESFMILNKPWLQFFPTLCFDLTYYLFGGSGPVKYCEFWSSVLVTVSIIVLLYVVAHIVFKKKDIKNQ